MKSYIKTFGFYRIHVSFGCSGWMLSGYYKDGSTCNLALHISEKEALHLIGIIKRLTGNPYIP